MREIPILMSGPMVKATLAGQKTQTRRVIAPPKWERVTRREKECWHFKHATVWDTGTWHTWDRDGNGGENWRESTVALAKETAWLAAVQQGFIRCPFGAPGDRLWVRETFWCDNDTDGEEGQVWDCGSTLSLGKDFAEVEYCATPNCLSPPTPEHRQTVVPHEGDVQPGDWWLSPPDTWDGEDQAKWSERGQWVFLPRQFFTKHPSIHMPRWASRLTLELLSVRVERLQEITEADAIAEGVGRTWCDDQGETPGRWLYFTGVTRAGYGHETAREAFRELWDSINAKPECGWDASPFVWVIEFRRAQP